MTSPGGATAATMTVPLRLDTGTVDAKKLEWTQVTVTGVLRGGRLAISSAADITSRTPSHEDVAILAHDTDASFVRSGRLRHIARRPPAERSLIEQGVLLDAWTDEHTGRRIALATDTKKARTALAEHYGQMLDVVESRWRADYLDKIRASVDERLVLSSGTTVGPGSQMQVALTLLHLPTDVARRLSRYDPAALDLSVLIRPSTQSEK